MELKAIQRLLHFLTEKSIPCCIVGELALSYYNVPRVVHDLEICVPAADLEKVEAIFMSKSDLEPATEDSYNIYTEQRRGLPRFRYQQDTSFYVALFPDDYLSLAPVQQNVITANMHGDGAEYSQELSDMIPTSGINKLPLPLLGPFFAGQCKKYLEFKYAVFAMAAEQMVDGMDLDEDWCKQHMPDAAPEELSFALKLVERKASRMDYFSPNTVTCYIATEVERQRLLRVPGRNTER